nr:MAG TPA: hypothetical protein [Caudoviricetes sp.]
MSCPVVFLLTCRNIPGIILVSINLPLIKYPRELQRGLYRV